MKLGILGSGLIVRDVLPLLAAMKKEGTIETCYLFARESSVERASQLCDTWQLDGVFLDYEELLKTDIDTVYVALPNMLHFEFTKKALECGKHAIVEKPIVLTSKELSILRETAKTHGVLLMEAMSLHFTPAYHVLRDTLPELGPVRMISFQFCQYSSRYDAFLEGHIAPAFDPACAGGALMDLNVYNLHAIIGLFGRPKSFTYQPNMQRGIDTSGVVTLDYGDCKAVALAAKDCQAPVHSTISGEKACLTIPMPMNQISAFTMTDRKGQLIRNIDFQEDVHRLSYEFYEFERMIREKDFARADRLLETSAIVTEILEALRPY